MNEHLTCSMHINSQKKSLCSSSFNHYILVEKVDIGERIHLFFKTLSLLQIYPLSSPLFLQFITLVTCKISLFYLVIGVGRWHFLPYFIISDEPYRWCTTIVVYTYIFKSIGSSKGKCVLLGAFHYICICFNLILNSL